VKALDRFFIPVVQLLLRRTESRSVKEGGCKCGPTRRPTID